MSLYWFIARKVTKSMTNPIDYVSTVMSFIAISSDKHINSIKAIEVSVNPDVRRVSRDNRLENHNFLSSDYTVKKMKA